jgi:hypothetical protein
MTITKPCPKEVERRAQAEYERDAQKHGSSVTWARRCETVRNAYRAAVTRAIAQESMA